MKDDLSYERKTQIEGAFWGKIFAGIKPDYRLRQKTSHPQYLWDDPEVEDITRGVYKERLLHPSERKGLRVLELGCGNGQLSLELARQGYRIDAHDISESAIKSAKDYYHEILGREIGLGVIEYHISDLNKVELPKDAFDVAICWDSLHHILESRSLIQRVYSALKTEGRFLIFDHIGQETKFVNWVNGFFSIALSPRAFAGRFCRKLRQKLQHRLNMRQDEEQLYSPFEDVTGKEMVNYVIETFGSQQVSFETTLAFGASWFAKIRLPRKLRLSVIAFLKGIDTSLIKRRMAVGEYVFIEATKRR